MNLISLKAKSVHQVPEFREPRPGQHGASSAPKLVLSVLAFSSSPRLLMREMSPCEAHSSRPREQHTAGVHNVPGLYGRCEVHRDTGMRGCSPSQGPLHSRLHSPVNGMNIHPPSTWLGLPAGQAWAGAALAAWKCLLIHQLQAGLTRGEPHLPAGPIAWAHPTPSLALQGWLRPQTGGRGQRQQRDLQSS